MNPTNHFVPDSTGHLWIFEGQRVRCLDPTTGIVEAELHSPAPINHALRIGSTIYVATELGVLTLHAPSQTWSSTPGMTELNQALSHESIYRLYPYDGQSLLIVTHQHGFYLFDHSTLSTLPTHYPSFPFSAPQGEITAVYTDSHHNLWLGTRRAGYRAIYHRQSIFSQDYRLTSYFSGRYISSMYIDQQDNLWVIADNCDLYRCDNQGTIHPRHEPHQGIL